LWCRKFLCPGHRVIFLGAHDFIIESKDRKRREEGNCYHICVAPVEYCGCDGFHFSKACWHLDFGKLLAAAIQRFITKKNPRQYPRTGVHLALKEQTPKESNP
jgi:hypothetical protein